MLMSCSALFTLITLSDCIDPQWIRVRFDVLCNNNNNNNNNNNRCTYNAHIVK